MAATPKEGRKEEKEPAPLLPAVQPAPHAPNAPAAQSAVQLNQVAVRKQLDVAAVHAVALEKLEHELETLSGKNLEPKHSALFFENVVKKEAGSQQQAGRCMACNTSVSSTGAYKFHSHILACPLMPAAVKKGFKELREQTERKRESKRQIAVVQQEEAQIAAQQHAADQLRLKQQCIRAGLHGAVSGSEAGKQTEGTEDQPEAGGDLRTRGTRRRGNLDQGVGGIRGRGSRGGGRTVRKWTDRRRREEGGKGYGFALAGRLLRRGADFRVQTGGLPRQAGEGGGGGGGPSVCIRIHVYSLRAAILLN